MAKPPAEATPGTAPDEGNVLPAAGLCGLASTGTQYWVALTMSDDAAATWLYTHPAQGMTAIVYATSSGNSITATRYVLDAAAKTSTQGLLFSVILNSPTGVIIRVDAVRLPQGAACVAKNAPKQPTFPVANPRGKVDAASQQKADSWLAGAVVPPGAVRSSTQPPGVASGPTTDMWCTPMADAVGYWTLPSMSADDALTWLSSHASQGMKVTGGSGNPRTGNATNVGGTVVDEPAPMSLEALIFTVTPIGSGSGIRADAFAKAASSVCATPPPGTMLGIGG